MQMTETTFCLVLSSDDIISYKYWRFDDGKLDLRFNKKTYCVTHSKLDEFIVYPTRDVCFSKIVSICRKSLLLSTNV